MKVLRGLFLFWLSCGGANSPPVPNSAPTSAPTSGLTSAPKSAPDPVPALLGGFPSGLLPGVCEASALVWMDGKWVVGDNEVDDRLFLFDASFQAMGSLPVYPPVKDIEALLLQEGKLIVVGSFSRKKSGKEDPERRRILQLGKGELPVSWEGCPLCAAAMSETIEGKGLNVEGAFWDEDLWLGLRAPVPEGKTLLVRAKNGEMRAIDTGGRGVREALSRKGELLLVLGPPADAPGAFQLWSHTRGVLSELPESLEGLAEAPDGELWGVTDGAKGEKGGLCLEPSRWVRVGRL